MFHKATIGQGTGQRPVHLCRLSRRLNFFFAVRGGSRELRRLADRFIQEHAESCDYAAAPVSGRSSYSKDFPHILKRYGFGPVLLSYELARARPLDLAQVPDESLTVYHPAIHGSLWHAPRLLLAALVSPEWLRFMLVRRVDSRSSVVVTRTFSSVFSLSSWPSPNPNPQSIDPNLRP